MKATDDLINANKHKSCTHARTHSLTRHEEKKNRKNAYNVRLDNMLREFLRSVRSLHKTITREEEKSRRNLSKYRQIGNNARKRNKWLPKLEATYTRTHTFMHACTHQHTWERIHTHPTHTTAQPHIHARMYIHTLEHRRAQTGTNTHPHAHPHAPTRTDACTHPRARSHARTL